MGIRDIGEPFHGRNPEMVPRILTVAGSDSGGGAGIQADLKTISLLGGFGMSAITALTAQNTQGVKNIYEVPADFVSQQMEAVISDIGIDALKTGMLVNPSIVRAVCQKIRQYRIRRVVVDPVMVAKNGERLLSTEGEEILKKELLPLAQVMVPNLPESEVLTGKKVRDLKGMQKAAIQIFKMGAQNVLIKGGHLNGEPVDIFFDGDRIREFQGIRIPTPHTHGTGCTLSAAIALELAKGNSPAVAVGKAKEFIQSAIQFSFPMGHGQGPVNPYAFIAREIERNQIIPKLKKALQILQENEIRYLFIERQTNLGYALPYARGAEDVAAFPGGMMQRDGKIFSSADPAFGASRHIAEVIVTVMRHDPDMRSAMNIRLTKEILVRARKSGFVSAHFDLEKKPRGERGKGGFPLPRGVQQIFEKAKKIPDIIFDRGEIGIEPMVRILGHDPQEVVNKVLRLS